MLLIVGMHCLYTASGVPSLMAIEVQVTLVCDHYSSCKARVEVAATLRGKGTEKARIQLPYNLPKGWVATHEGGGFGSAPSEEFVCYCPEHSDRSIY
jgi:hypothetical protein